MNWCKTFDLIYGEASQDRAARSTWTFLCLLGHPTFGTHIMSYRYSCGHAFNALTFATNTMVQQKKEAGF